MLNLSTHYLISDKAITIKSKLLWASILLQIYASLGWIAIYPFGGYVQLLAIALFVVLRIHSWRLLVTALVPLIVWSLLPREYGLPNTAQLLSLISFVLLITVSDIKLTKIHEVFSKTLCILCCCSLIVMVLAKFHLWGEGRSINLDPQFFTLRWPFYLERLNISKGSELEFFLLASRFHGPFFEPGLLGVVIGVSMFSSVSSRYKVLLTFFGLMTFSMSFFALFAIKILEVLVTQRKVMPLLMIAGTIVLGYMLLPKDGFIYSSTYGRLLGEGDKVLDTRNSIHEIEQIELIDRTFRTDLMTSVIGLGWDIPGSGGSYRAWVASVGLSGTILFLLFYLYRNTKSFGIISVRMVSRTAVLLICCYAFGNWCFPFFLFINDLEET